MVIIRRLKMKFIDKFALVLLGMIFIAGCHTVKGAGEDISAGGKALSNAAVKVDSKM
jgi:predicted small secreted protein